jgi:Calcineurin-like phosphoesterase/Purple acid Phosphatase, N-terminal domain
MLLVMAVVIIAVAPTACSSSAAGNRPGSGWADEVHLGWDHDPRHTIVVQWHTKSSRSDRAIVLSGGTWRAVAGRAVSPVAHGPGFWHEAAITGLSPVTTYQYAMAGDGGMSAAYTFTTAPDGPAPFTFDVFADQCDCVTFKAACRVIAGITADRPAFVFGAGDLTYANDHGPDAVDRWLNAVQAYAASAPLLTTPGNHEYRAGDPHSRFPTSIDDYKARFDVPNEHGKDYYSLDYGALHLVALPEEYVDMRPGKAFNTWLVSDLQAARHRRSVRWIIAIDHRPFYSTGTRHGSEPVYDRDVLPVLEHYHADLVISGHEHNYERTFPLRASQPTTRDSVRWAQGEGTAFVVTGGGGAHLDHDFGPPVARDAVRQVVHEHLRIDVGPNSLVCTAVGDNGAVIDSFTITG